MIAAAVEAFNDVELDGRTMRVNKLLPKEEIEKTRRDRNYTPDGTCRGLPFYACC